MLGVGALLREAVPVAWEAQGVPLALALPLLPPLPVAAAGKEGLLLPLPPPPPATTTRATGAACAAH